MTTLRYMPKYRRQETPGLDLTFRALGDPSRRAMLVRLARGPASVTELAQPFDMALPSVVQHLRVLEDAQIVASSKVGRVRSYQLVPDALTPAGTWLSGIRLPAEKKLDRLDAYLARDSDSRPAERKHPTEETTR
jgi:DNA-binding transcriptional ArsR family regulator